MHLADCRAPRIRAGQSALTLSASLQIGETTTSKGRAQERSSGFLFSLREIRRQSWLTVPTRTYPTSCLDVPPLPKNAFRMSVSSEARGDLCLGLELLG
jgi:hypothetical protein